MKKFISTTLKFLAFCAVIASAYVAIGYFLKHKTAKLNKLISKRKNALSNEDE